MTAASATVSNVVGMIGAEAGMSVQYEALKVQWYGLLPSPYLSLHHPFFLTASTSSTKTGAPPSPKRTHTSSAYHASSRPATASHGTRLPSTTASQYRNSTARSPEPVRPPGPLDLSTHPHDRERWWVTAPRTHRGQVVRSGARAHGAHMEHAGGRCVGHGQDYKGCFRLYYCQERISTFLTLKPRLEKRDPERCIEDYERCP